MINYSVNRIDCHGEPMQTRSIECRDRDEAEAIFGKQVRRERDKSIVWEITDWTVTPPRTWTPALSKPDLISRFANCIPWPFLAIAGFIFGRSRFLIWLIFCGVLTNSFGAEIIGTNALLSIDDRIYNRDYVRWNPGNGQTVTLNPPRFSWPYNVYGRIFYGPAGWYTNAFQFQCSYSNDFTAPVVNVRTPYNYYNFIDSFDTNISSTIYWRIGYLTNRTAFTNWSATRTFVISNGAPVWNRGMYASDSFHSTNNTHPRIFFRSNDVAAVASWIRANYPTVYANTTNSAGRLMTNSYWTNFSANPYGTYQWAYTLSDVAWAGYVSENDYYRSNRQAAINYMWSVTNWMTLSGGIGSPGWNDGTPYWMGLLYDWLYNNMTADERTYAVSAMSNHLQYISQNYQFNFGQGGGGWRVYGGNAQIQAESHTFALWAHVAPGVLSMSGDSPTVREYYNAWVNYVLGLGHPWDFDEEGMDRMHGYAQAIMKEYGIGMQWPVLAVTYFEHGWTNHPGFKLLPEFFMWMEPVGYRLAGDDTWGDGGWGYLGQSVNAGVSGYYGTLYADDAARIAHSGEMVTHAQRTIQNKTDGTGWAHTTNVNSISLPLRYYYSLPAATEGTNLSRIFQYGGWAFGYSHHPNSYDAYSNGVAFILAARPHSTDGNHTGPSDSAPEIWAYGAAVTWGGGEYTQNMWNGATARSRNTIGINGRWQSHETGLADTEIPNRSFHGRFEAWRQGENYIYVRGNYLSNYFSNGESGTGDTFGTTKANRHLLFMRSKYFVIYDDLASQSNSIFTWTWQVKQPELSNFWAGGFEYTSSNLYAGRLPITNILRHIAYTNQIGLLCVTSLTAMPLIWKPSDGWTGTAGFAAPNQLLLSNSITVQVTNATPNSVLYYTTNGDTPTTNSAIYGGPLTWSNAITLKVIAKAPGQQESWVQTFDTKFITPQPTYNPQPTNATALPTNVVLTSDVGATIYYSTNFLATIYSGPSPLTVSNIGSGFYLYSYASNDNRVQSYISFGYYEVGAGIQPVIYTPTTAVGPGEYVPPGIVKNSMNASNNITINPITGVVADNGVQFKGSWDWRRYVVYVTNSAPTTNWHFMTVVYPVYSGDPLPTITRLDDYTVAITNGSEGDVISFDKDSPVATLAVDIGATNEPPPAQTLQPSFTPAAGSHPVFPTNVLIATASAGPNVWLAWKFDAGAYSWTNSSNVTVTITNSGTTLYSQATNLNETASNVRDGLYTTNSLPTCGTPIFDPVHGTEFLTSLQFSISSPTNGATIYYTTDGVTTPSAASTEYIGSPVTITASQTNKAIAILTGHNNSAVATATYTKTNEPAPPASGGRTLRVRERVRAGRIN